MNSLIAKDDSFDLSRKSYGIKDELEIRKILEWYTDYIDYIKLEIYASNTKHGNRN